MRTFALMSVLLCLTCSGTAQSKLTEAQALKDAEYSLRRFEEVTARIDFNRLKAPGTTIGRSQETMLNLTQTQYVDEAKTILKRFEGKRKPTSTELLSIMVDVERAGNALLNLSDLLLNFQDPQATVSEAAETNALAGELVTASNTAYTAMMEFFVVLHDRIGVEEDLLKACAQSASKKKTSSSN
jgi:hypothetical protein